VLPVLCPVRQLNYPSGKPPQGQHDAGPGNLAVLAQQLAARNPTIRVQQHERMI